MNKIRLEKVLEKMAEKKIDHILVSDPAAIFYMTGKWIHPGERMLVLYISGKGDHKLFINELFPITEDLGLPLVWFKDTDKPVDVLCENIEKGGVMGIDKNWPSGFFLKLMDKNAADRYVNSSEIIDHVRMIKDEDEKQLMRNASALNDEAMGKMIAAVSRGLSEKKMGQLLGEIWEEIGAEGHSFPPIVGYGKNAADPHHELDSSVAKPGDCVVIDMGCRKDSYCSDMTRTVFYKFVPEKSREVYEIVKEANRRGIAAVKPGARFCDIDAAARDYITEKGYGKYFTHRLGHSIGIEVHDFGDVSAVNTDRVQVGQIFSIEPGIYLPGEVGVRIEDLVIVTEDGCEVLNRYSKDITVVE